MRLLHARCNVESSAELEAAGVLQRLARQNKLDAQLFRKSGGVDDSRRPRGSRRHRRPGGFRGLRGLMNLRMRAMNRKRIPAHRIAASSVLMPQASSMAAISISASFAIVNGLTGCPSCEW